MKSLDMPGTWRNSGRVHLKPFCKGGLTMGIHIHKGGISPEHINFAIMVLLLAVMGLAIFYYGASFQVPAHQITAMPSNVPL
jgi:hypothetical protein